MKASATFALIASALTGALAAVHMPHAAHAAEPPADITGLYAGKGSYRNQDIVGDLGGSGPLAFDASATQTGNDLDLALTLDAGDEVLEWNLSGRTGNGRFFALGSVGEGELVLFAGTAKGKTGKIALKSKGLFLGPDHFAELKFAVKQTAAPE